MALRLYNVRTRQKEDFRPLDPEGKQVGVYVCGLTVYDHAHLGHARTYVSFEVIRRWLELTYGEGNVTFIQNVTDVEDKILNRAKELGVSPLEHSAKWDQIAHDALRRTGVRDADDYPHVTTSIPDIVQFIERIIERGHAYVTDAGNVYFDVPGYDEAATSEFPGEGYGRLSGRDFRQMAAGTRKEVQDDKRHPADFALWKSADPETDHPDGYWDSPWGTGRPGWHIECSLMSTRALGDRIDIHGGGQDLIFPHHENEIAQSQAATGVAPFVNVWMHTGFLNVDGQKMSKSLGNFIVLDELLDEMDANGIDPAVLRFYFVQTHYRSKIDFSRQGLDEAKVAVERLERTRRRLHEVAASDAIGCADVDPVLEQAVKDAHDAFHAAMDDDVHTPSAIAALWDVQRAANAALDSPADSPLGSAAARHALKVFETMGQVLTLFDRPVATDDGPPAELVTLLQEREAARAAKDWGTADRLRDELTAAGWRIQDTPDGPRLEKA